MHSFVLALVERGLKFDSTVSLQHAAKAGTMSQSKSVKIPPFVPAFSSKVVALLLQQQQVWPHSIISTPAAKLLHEFETGEAMSVKQALGSETVSSRLHNELDVHGLSGIVSNFGGVDVVFDRVKIFGLQWEPLQFLEKACSVTHPMDLLLSLPAELSDAISSATRDGFHTVAKQRAEFFKRWSKRAEELVPAEQELRKGMDPMVNCATAGKRLLLFKEMLEFYKYPDVSVFEELCKGSDLTGTVEQTHMLPFKFTPAILTESALKVPSSFRLALIPI